MEDESRETQCILVADSDVLERHAIADYLRNCGYIVIEATSSDEVVTVLEAEHVSVDVMLCDVQIKGQKTGFELRAWVREERPALKVTLAGSVEKTAEAAAELCDEGPQLSRPYDPQMVVNHIKALLGGGNKAS